MRAGELDRRITIQKATKSQDAAGQEIPGWAVLATVWAGVTPLRGEERFTAQQQQRSAHVDTKFRIRWRGDVAPDRNRILDEYGREFDIVAVLEVGRREGLDIMATARAEAL